MNARTRFALAAALAAGVLQVLHAADIVPTDVQQPGTQPQEVSTLEASTKCDNCHGGYAATVEPARNWRGSAMAQAGRDPLFWATLAVVEQDFDGAGDLCLRCHSPQGWVAGRSTPTDGSSLQAKDADGVNCDFCHHLTNPDASEWVGVQNAPFLAHDDSMPAVAYSGSGMYVLWGGSEKLGPFDDANPPHAKLTSGFHRDAALCGTCHDVSNPVVGDLAPNNGSSTPLTPGTFSGVPGAAVAGKAAFNNFPYLYGVVERTFSEHQASAFATLAVSDYPSLPEELKAGSIRAAYEAALVAGEGGDYDDGSERLFTCQSCHMPPVTGQGCNKNPPVRPDLPMHDQTGGNYWLGDAIVWLDDRGLLRLGGGVSTDDRASIAAGQARARATLSNAASLAVDGDSVRVVNLTGHRLPSGYPEGRRMWLNVRWYDGVGALLREDGAYDTFEATIDGGPVEVASLVDLEGTHTRIWEAHMGMSQEWAAALVSLGVPGSLPLAYDRVSGATTVTLGELAAEAPGSVEETFHFALNNVVASDDRIPPYGLRRDQAIARNANPVPVSLFGDPASTGSYDYFDVVPLEPPLGAATASIRLLYQPTSWEYVQFLELANDESNAFLADEGENLRAAWLATGMAEPHVMAEASWPAAPPALVFADGFEGGDSCDWSGSVGGGCGG